MDGAAIKTTRGYLGACWSAAGLAALTLPFPEPAEALLAAARCAGCSGAEFRQIGDDSRVTALEQALGRYFAGDGEEFDLPVDWSAYTPFRRRVLQEVRKISRGRVLSYGQVAALVGCPGGARAVGGALGANRTVLVVPCHRVVRGDGTPGGFTGGPAWKEALLRLEGCGL
jgi:methylated-DNA-[protein]-cysteine S-methyltransferase